MTVEPHPEGVILLVKALPGARQAGIRGIQAGALVVAVTVKAEQGKANRAILDLLCEELDIRRSQISLVSAPTVRQKRFLIRGLTAEALRKRISGWTR